MSTHNGNTEEGMAKEEELLKGLETFITTRLPQKLHWDLHDGRIVKEADLECAAYFHLRRYLGDDDQWRILARKHVPLTGYRIDLVIFRGEEAAFAFELKWAKEGIGDKDASSLDSAIEHLRVRRAFWITALPEIGAATEVRKGDSRRVFEIRVRPGLSGTKLAGWKDKRRKFTKDMEEGVRKTLSKRAG